MREPYVVTHLSKPHPLLWMVSSYIDLITRLEPLTYGEGLKRVYTLSSGAATLNDDDVEAITMKSERMGLLPKDLTGFMYQSIIRNCALYGEELLKIISDRIIRIGRGDIVNPAVTLKYSDLSARRNYYLPPITLMKRVQKAILEDTFTARLLGHQPMPSLEDVATDAWTILSRMQGDNGVNTPEASAFGAMTSICEELVAILKQEAQFADAVNNYKERSRPALMVLLVFAKLISGDLTVRPQRQDMNFIDLSNKLSFRDGTLAALPFPTQETISLFNEGGSSGVSMKGRIYLSAVSSVVLYNQRDRDED